MKKINTPFIIALIIIICVISGMILNTVDFGLIIGSLIVLFVMLLLGYLTRYKEE